MKDLSPDEIIKKIKISCEIIDCVTMTDDYKTNNKEAKKINKISKVIESDIEIAKYVYEKLLNDECLTTLITTLAHDGAVIKSAALQTIPKTSKTVSHASPVGSILLTGLLPQ